MSGNPPTSILRDGNLKASIWENEGKKGTYYTTTFTKIYEDKNKNVREISVFNNSDLLKVSELARQAYGRTNDLRQEHLQSLEVEQSQDLSTEPSQDDRKARMKASMQNARAKRNQSNDYDQGR